MQPNHNQKINHFFTSVKIWWIILFSVGLITLFIFSLAFLVQNNDKLWETSATILSFLGIMITVGAAIPAISAIFSYMGFTENHKKAEEQLNDIKEKLKEYDEQFKKLPDIQQIIKDKETEKYFLDYLKQSDNKELIQWVTQHFEQPQSNPYLILLAKAAKALYYYHFECDQPNGKHYDIPALDHLLDLITSYRQLALIDPYFIHRYFSTLTNTLNNLTRELGYEEKDNFYQAIIYDLVIDLIRFDEMPETKSIIVDNELKEIILDLYQNNFLNSDQFRNDVKSRIYFLNSKEQRISTLLGIKKMLFSQLKTQ